MRTKFSVFVLILFAFLSGSGALASTLPISDTEEAYGRSSISLTPMSGIGFYVGAWSPFITNRITFGLLTEIPITHFFSAEVEASYASNTFGYLSHSHDFEQYSVGGDLKAYLTRGKVRPYLGLGLLAMDYENMTYGPLYHWKTYSKWIGSGQLIAGTEVGVARDLSVGLRGAWIVPMLNRPANVDNGIVNAPGYEEAAAINTHFFRVLGTVKVTL